MTQHCPNCGFQRQGDEIFCANCGTKLSKPAHNSEDIPSAPQAPRERMEDIQTPTPVKTKTQPSHKTHTHSSTKPHRIKEKCHDVYEEVYDTHMKQTENKKSSSTFLAFSILVLAVVIGVIFAHQKGYITIGSSTPNTENDEKVEQNNDTELMDGEEQETGKSIFGGTEKLQNATAVETPKKSLDERAEEFIRWHYEGLGSGDAYEMWDNYAPEFIRDCEKNKKPSLCDRSKFANLWRGTRGAEVRDFNKIGHLKYKYTVKVTDSNGSAKYYTTEMTLHENGDSFLITWYNAT